MAAEDQNFTSVNDFSISAAHRKLTSLAFAAAAQQIPSKSLQQLAVPADCSDHPRARSHPSLCPLPSYFGEDISRNAGCHEDGAELLQQPTVEHGLLTAAGGTRRVRGGHQDPHKLQRSKHCRVNKAWHLLKPNQTHLWLHHKTELILKMETMNRISFISLLPMAA